MCLILSDKSRVSTDPFVMLWDEPSLFSYAMFENFTHLYKKFINAQPTPSPPTLHMPTPSPLIPSNIMYSFLSNWVHLVLTVCPWVWGHPVECGWYIRGPAPIENWPSSQSYKLQIAQLQMGFHGSFSTFVLASDWFDLVQVLCINPLSPCVHRLQWSC